MGKFKLTVQTNPDNDVEKLVETFKETLINRIADRVKANKGRVNVKVVLGEARCHNETWTDTVIAVTNTPTNLFNMYDMSEHELYYVREYCYDTPIEKLGSIDNLIEIAKQCENDSNKTQ